MAKLSQIISSIGYAQPTEQIAFVKLLAYRDCFSKFDASFSESKEVKPQQLERIKKVVAARNKSNLKEVYLNHKDSIIDDAEALSLLDIEFDSLLIAFDWLLNITQIKFLRESFDSEGLGKEKEKTGINLARYNPKDEIAITDLENKFDKTSNEYQLYQAVKTLGLIDATPFPKDKNIKHIVIHACVEKYAIERIAFLESIFAKFENDAKAEEVTLYYPTNPRGAFNDEVALLELLTKQFGDLSLKPKIQRVLDSHKNGRDPKRWQIDLNGLKNEILEATGCKEWPSFPDSFYYQNAEAYEARAKSEGRHSLKDFPVGTDVINFYINKLRQKYPNASKKIKLVETIGSGKDGKPAVTEDLIKAWYESIGKNIVLESKSVTVPVAFVSDNTYHAIWNQDKVVQDLLKHVSNMKIITVGPEAKKFSPATAIDRLTVTLYSMQNTIKTELAAIACLNSSSLFSAKPSISDPDHKPLERKFS